MLSVNELEDKLIDLAFAEDIGDGDHTTLCCIPEDAMGRSKLLIKEDGVLAGVEVAKEVFHRFDPEMKVEVFLGDGSVVKKGDVAMVVTGKVRSLLQTERLMLNIMQRMSGIATMTSKYVERLKGTHTKVLDTRKTTPGMRMLEKQAVKIGGGCNHRIGLFDMILLKDNHIDFCGGIENAIDRCHKYLEDKGLDLKIEIEVRNFDELGRVMAHGGVDRVMFDNFTVAAVGQQYDLMFSNRSYNRTSSMNQSGDITYNGVDITFKHALSSIVFKVGTDADYAGADLDFKVKKIEIQGVNNKGNFNENLTDGNNENTRNPEWTDQTGAVNYIAFEGSFAVPENGTDRVEPTGAADLILLPQLIPDGAMVVVEYTIETMTSGEITQTATFELKPNTDNNTWTLGKRYTYNIIFGGMEKIYFAPVVEDWDDVESNVDFEI